MINKLKLPIIFLLHLLCILSSGQEMHKSSTYHLSIKIDPDTHMITGSAEIQFPGGSFFSLDKNLKISRILVEGKETTIQSKPSFSKEYSTEYSISGRLPERLVIEYSGKISGSSYPPAINSLNMIREGLVELSDFIDWYPKMKNSKSFLFKLDSDLPENYVSVTNCILKKKQSVNDHNLTKWESSCPVYGISLVSAPDLKMSDIVRNDYKIEIYCSKLPLSYIDSMMNDLMKSIEMLTDIFGLKGSNTLARIIYSPRSAGGYARAPLILVSEPYALEQLSQKYGYARDFRLNTHEIAHYWSKADANTYDDWINEGLAEYSALLVSEKIMGKNFYDVMVGEYEGIVNNSLTEYPIAETPANSREREVNRYYKPTLLFNNLEQKYGEERMKVFLRGLYLRFSLSKTANTSIFLEELEKNFGKVERDSFSDALYRKNWYKAVSVSDTSYLPSDSTYIGTWTGPLTQFGATVRFVLNIYIKDGKVNPSLDSPDQNVTGIPITDFKMEGDSVSFRIGVASAGYRGHLNRSTMIIQGEFSQRGGTYPLNLSKSK